MTPETLHRKVAEFEATYNYDATFQHELIDAAPASAAIFATIPMLVDRNAAPASALAAAAMAAFITEDCEPCAQVSLDIAVRTGADPAILRAIVAADEAAMGDDAALAWRFAHAFLARDEATAAPLRNDIVRRWGAGGLMAVALSVVTARAYPTLKYALGHGKPIRQLSIDGKPASLGFAGAQAA